MVKKIYGKLNRFYKKLTLKKKRNVKIMENVFIDDNCVIGDFTFIGKNSDITKSSIGRYCSIGTDVIIGPGEHEIDKISTSAHFHKGNFYDELTKKTLTIGNDVWIGTKAIILRGVTIGNGAVIASGAVVTKNVPPFAVVAGVPAKIVKFRFDDETIKLIETSKWWNYDIEYAEEIHKNLKVKELVNE